MQTQDFEDFVAMYFNKLPGNEVADKIYLVSYTSNHFSSHLRCFAARKMNNDYQTTTPFQQHLEHFTSNRCFPSLKWITRSLDSCRDLKIYNHGNITKQ